MTTRNINKPSAAGRALLDDLGITYKVTAFDVTVDEFDSDESLGWGPGSYNWIEVDAAIADRWDAGIAECTRRGLETGRPDGLSLRRHILAGEDPATWTLPTDIAKSLAAKDAERQAAADAKAQRSADLAALLAGLEPTQYVPESVHYVSMAAMEVVRANEDGRDSRLPNGLGWTRVLRHPDGWLLTHFADGCSITTAWVEPATADAFRLAWAERMERAGHMTVDSARKLAAPDYDYDLRRMAEVWLAAHDGG